MIYIDKRNKSGILMKHKGNNMATENRKLINSSSVKKMSLALMEASRPGKFTRVSNEWLDRLSDKFASVIREEVAAHPTLGKTLK